jgi:hypothetical protein
MPGGGDFVAPEAHSGYARCLVGVGRKPEAAAQWLVAAEHNLEAGFGNEARTALASADKLGIPEADRKRRNLVASKLPPPSGKSNDVLAVPPP